VSDVSITSDGDENYLENFILYVFQILLNGMNEIKGMIHPLGCYASCWSCKPVWQSCGINLFCVCRKVA